MILPRRIKSRRYSQIFCDSKEAHSGSDKSDEVVVTASGINMKALMGDDVPVPKSQTKMYDKVKLFNNYPDPPTTSPPFDDAMDTQSLCEHCHNPAIHDVMRCISCGCVVHFLCFQQMGIPGQFVCEYCSTSRQDDLDFHAVRIKKIEERNERGLCEKYVGAKAISFLQRKAFLDMKKKATRIQAMIRKRKARRNFYQWRRNVMRVACLGAVPGTATPYLEKIVACSIAYNRKVFIHNRPTSPEHSSEFFPFMVLTAIDPIKKNQIFRFDKPWNNAFSEGCFIPGISAQTIVVVTVMLKNVHATSLDSVEVPLCQAQLQLRDFDNFLVPKERIPILFLEYITWLPQATNDLGRDVVAIMSTCAHKKEASEGSVHGRSTDVGDMLDKVVHSLSTSLIEEEDTEMSIMLSYFPFNPIGSLCIPILGPHMTTLRKATTAIGGSALNNMSTTSAAMATDDASVNTAYTMEDSTVATLSTTASKSPKRRSARLKSSAVKTVRSTCSWWLCLAGLRIYFYLFHGDEQPRYVSNIMYCELDIRGSSVNILHRDGREWLIHFMSYLDCRRFCFAVQECQYSLQAKSIYMKSYGGENRHVFGHHCLHDAACSPV